MKSKFKSLVLFLLIIFSLVNFAQQKVDYDKLNQYIQDHFSTEITPGLAIGIIKDSSIVFEKTYGYRNIETEEPVTEESIFGIASLSKAFTSAAIGILVDEGKLKLDDKVRDYIPWFALHDPYPSEEMTIEDLLCHRSGLTTFDGDLLWYGTDYDRKEVVKRIRHLKLKNGFRYRYGYQNVMFIAAGEVIESVTGKTWDEFVKERIFNPLNMENTNTSTTEYVEGENWALPHVDGKIIDFINYDNAGPAASINSSLDDLLKWVQLWLNKGNIGDKEIFSRNYYEAATNVETPLPVFSGNNRGMSFRGYGLGWFLSDYSDTKVVEHGGGLPGVHTKIVFAPEYNLGFVILSNQINGMIDALMYKILDVHLNDNDIDWVKQGVEGFNAYFGRMEEQRKEKEEKRISGTEPLEFSAYTGTYEDEMYGPAKIEEVDGKLVLTLIPTNELFTSTMEHWQYNTFRIKFKDEYLPEGFVNFNLNSVGEVTEFTIDLPNPDFHFYNLDFKKVK